ncbi:MAG: caspase family protein, partial [Pseudonocardiaceae bacterium]
MAQRRALLIGVERYQELPALVASRADVVRLGSVLGAEEIGGYHVQTLIDPSADEARRAIADFFMSAREPDEQRLLYFAGHGLTDSTGRLFLGMTDTRPDL